MDKLLALVERENIFLHYDNLNINRRLFGLYFYDPDRDRPYILLDNSLKSDYPMHRSVLAEELGHHFTIPQTNFLAPYTSYSMALKLGRDERRALRWACNFLMPMSEFHHAVESGITEIPALAEYFSVTPWLVRRRIDFAVSKVESNFVHS